MATAMHSVQLFPSHQRSGLFSITCHHKQPVIGSKSSCVLNYLYSSGIVRINSQKEDCRWLIFILGTLSIVAWTGVSLLIGVVRGPGASCVVPTAGRLLGYYDRAMQTCFRVHCVPALAFPFSFILSTLRSYTHQVVTRIRRSQK